MREHFIDVGTGGPLRYLRGGNPNGQPLILLHGVHLRAEYFQTSIAPYLEQRYDLYALDLRGHGQSLRSDEHYTLSNYARDVVAFHRQLIGKPCHLLGFSLGGNVALRACIAAPALAQRLVMVDIAPFVHPAGVARILNAQAGLPERFESFDALRSYFEQAYQGVQPIYTTEVLKHMWRPDGAGGFEPTYDRRIWDTPPELGEAELRRAAEGATQLDIPVLLLRGGDSDILSREGAEQMLQLLPHGRLKELPGTDHGILHEQPEACAQAIDAFLQESIQHTEVQP